MIASLKWKVSDFRLILSQKCIDIGEKKGLIETENVTDKILWSKSKRKGLKGSQIHKLWPSKNAHGNLDKNQEKGKYREKHRESNLRCLEENM